MTIHILCDIKVSRWNLESNLSTFFALIKMYPFMFIHDLLVFDTAHILAEIQWVDSLILPDPINKVSQFNVEVIITQIQCGDVVDISYASCNNPTAIRLQLK